MDEKLQKYIGKTIKEIHAPSYSSEANNGNMITDSISFIFEDGEKIMIPLVEAVRKIEKVEAEVLSIAEDKEIEGNDDTLETTYFYKVKTADGKEIIISNKFIN
jgi:hypothetical protein